MLFLPFSEGFLTGLLAVLRGEIWVYACPAHLSAKGSQSGKPLPLFCLSLFGKKNCQAKWA
jgi:hypothetical protein